MTDRAPSHPIDHEPFWLFLRQARREEDVIVDVFYCARCLGRVDVVAGAEDDAGEHPGEIGVTHERRRRRSLPALGTAARSA